MKNSTDLADLLLGISEIEGNYWIRMFYWYPNTFSDGVMEVMSSDQRFYRYLDMPFQHISDPVLKK